MYPNLSQFKKWLKCQYLNSSASFHYSRDLVLFFAFIKKPPPSINPQDGEHYEHLKFCNSVMVWRNLASVAVELTHNFPKESVDIWREGQSLDLKGFSLDDRLTGTVFLQKLSQTYLEDAAVSIPNGLQKPSVTVIAGKLTKLPALSIAINT